MYLMSRFVRESAHRLDSLQTLQSPAQCGRPLVAVVDHKNAEAEIRIGIAKVLLHQEAEKALHRKHHD